MWPWGQPVALALQFSCFPPVTPSCAFLSVITCIRVPAAKSKGNGVLVCVLEALQPTWPAALGMSQNCNFHKAIKAIWKKPLHFFMKLDRKFSKLFQERKEFVLELLCPVFLTGERLIVFTQI